MLCALDSLELVSCLLAQKCLPSVYACTPGTCLPLLPRRCTLQQLLPPVVSWCTGGICDCFCTGDTLFLLGCGRTFEGTHEQMWDSLKKLLPLPDDTRVFCAHEYTQSNARFAVHIDPGNAVLAQRKEQIESMRKQASAMTLQVCRAESDQAGP